MFGTALLEDRVSWMTDSSSNSAIGSSKIEQKLPLTHIVIVNYNAGKWLQRSLSSALSYSFGPITVVDNDSTDDSVLDAKKNIVDGRLSWLLNTDNLGFAAANNQVLRELSAEYEVLMNPDCELEEDTLAEVLSAFEKEPSMGMASCRILNDDGSLQRTCRRRFPTPWSAFVRILYLHKLFPNSQRFVDFDYGEEIDPKQPLEFVEAISGAFMVVRQSALKEVGLFDENYFMHCEDLDWCKRFELSDWKVGFVASAQVVHAKGISSRSRPLNVLWTLHLGMNRFFNKFYTEHYSWPSKLVIKVGIALSFLVRAPFAWLGRYKSVP